MRNDGRWTDALTEHGMVVREFLATCQRIAPADWQKAPTPGKWSPAAVVLHVCRAYELGREAAVGGESMRLLVSPTVALFLRTLLLPVMFASKRFPSGAKAPREVRPDPAEAQLLMPDAAAARLQRAAEQAAVALRSAADRRPPPRFTHAYFGPLSPHTALRLLSAHTRHHTRGLAHPS